MDALIAQKPPEFLFVAVTVEESNFAFRNGLNRLKKPFIKLYESEREARKNFKKGFPSMFTILAEVMAEDGYVFYKAETGEWMTESIPKKYLRIS